MYGKEMSAEAESVIMKLLEVQHLSTQPLNVKD